MVSYIFQFSPQKLGKILQNWLSHIFSDGLVHPPTRYFFGKIHMIVSLNGATPNLHPKMISFSRKTHGFVGETHHLRKPPYSHVIIKSSAALFLKQILIFHLFDPVTRKGRWFHQVTLERVEVLSHNVLHELEEVMKESNLPWWKRMEKGKSRN